MKKRLTGTDIIGKKIRCVYEKATEKTGRFQNRLTFVRLDNDVLVNLDEIRYPKKDKALVLWDSDYENSFVQVLSIERDPNLDSPVKAIIFNEGFDINVAILLENDFVLTVAIGEFDMGYDFHLAGEAERQSDVITLENPSL